MNIKEIIKQIDELVRYAGIEGYYIKIVYNSSSKQNGTIKASKDGNNFKPYSYYNK